MSSHEQTLAAIQALYSAALDEALWPSALNQLTGLMGSQAASLWVLDGSDRPHLPTFITVNFDQESINQYLNGMAGLDPTVHYLVEHPQQAIVHDGLLTDRRDKDTRAYKDWHERNVHTRFRIVGQARRVGPGIQAGVALHRTSSAGRYEPNDVKNFVLLHGHLERALTIAFRMNSLDSMQRFSEQWLNRSDAAIILLDAHGQLVLANDTARKMQTSADGIRLTRDGLALSYKKENEQLQKLIAQTIAARGSLAEVSGGIMRASRPSGKLPLGITVTHVPVTTSAFTLFRPAVCVVISDPEAQPASVDRRIREAFHLTEAEAQLAALLHNGEDLREAAAKLNITYGTARTRLAQLFQKTDTRRQAQLVRLLLKTVSMP